jgi:alkanesulfonate monooxygenase SsuD/methylene tetrahydromethanopterin reductase-like flavin-dependent oxidoreductase (luciferase family)
MSLRFGILLSMDYDRARPLDEVAARVAQVELARDVGLDGVWLGEHRLAAPLAYFQSIPLAARLSASSGDLDLGVTIVAPYANPLVLAEDLATLDLLTRGHAIVGLAQGWRESERRAFGVLGDALPRYLDTVELLPRLWSGEPVAFAGRVHHVTGVRLASLPVQQPALPVWLGASSVAGVRRAARAGAVWLGSTQQPVPALREQADAYDASLPPGYVPPARPVLRNLIIDDGTAEAGRRLAAAREYYRTFASWGLWERFGIADASDEERLASVLIRGDAEECARQIVGLARMLRRDYFLMKVHWEGIDQAAVLSSIRALGTTIAPLARKLYDGA